MKSKHILLPLSIILTIAGCSLKEPSECYIGQEKCLNDSLNIGLYQVCLDTGIWSSPVSCGVSCEGQKCGENKSIPNCDEEGKIKCLSNNEGIVVSLYCYNMNLLAELCSTNQCSVEKGCLEAQTQCKEGENLSITIEETGTLNLVCTNQQWISHYSLNIHNNDTCEQECNLPNALESICDNGVCKAKSCEDGYHLYQDLCEKDDIDHCGNHDVQCTLENLPNNENVLDVKCSKNKECMIKTCALGYHINKDKCEANDMKNCGGHELKCDRYDINATDAECTREGQCLPKSCVECAHFYQGLCELDDDDHCGAHDLACNSKPYSGGTDYYCGNIYCYTSSCDNSHTHISSHYCLEKECTENAEKCLDYHGTSTVYKCINNEWIRQQDNCPNDYSCRRDLSQCGECKNGSLRCSGTESQVCEQGIWKTRYDCNPQNGSGTCTGEGICENIQCHEGYCVDNYRCVNNLDSNIYHCGGCGNNCFGIVEHSKEVQCVESECRALSCKHGYHEYEGLCEEDTLENCGGHGIVCNQYKHNVCCPAWTTNASCLGSDDDEVFFYSCEMEPWSDLPCTTFL